MSEFVASNGAVIGRNREQLEVTGDTYYEWIDLEAEKALREYFQHERDEELGRWRWPENPDFVVYPASVKSRVRVLHEKGMGELEWVDRGDERSYEFCHAARAYFEAHPERKPWHLAESGEVWVINIGGEGDLANWQGVVVSNGDRFLYRDGGSVALDQDFIIDGRKIWPEDAS